MSKSSIICKSCGTDNSRDSVFCVNCGTKLQKSEPMKPPYSETQNVQKYELEQQKNKFYKSLPVLIGVCIFLIFIDLVTGGGLEWAYWPVIPILIFGILIPWIYTQKEE